MKKKMEDRRWKIAGLALTLFLSAVPAHAEPVKGATRLMQLATESRAASALAPMPLAVPPDRYTLWPVEVVDDSLAANWIIAVATNSGGFAARTFTVTNKVFGISNLTHDVPRYYFRQTGVRSVALSLTASSSPNVVGYRAYSGTNSGQYSKMIALGNSITGRVDNLPAAATNFFALTSVDSASLESPYSPEVAFAPTARFRLSGTTNPPPPVSELSWPMPQQPLVRYVAQTLQYQQTPGSTNWTDKFTRVVTNPVGNGFWRWRHDDNVKAQQFSTDGIHWVDIAETVTPIAGPVYPAKFTITNYTTGGGPDYSAWEIPE